GGYRLFVLHEIVDPGNMHLRVTERTRKPWIHLQHDRSRRFDDVLLIRNAEGEGDITVLVRGRAGAEEDVRGMRVDPVGCSAMQHVRHVGDGPRSRLERLAGSGGVK